MAPLSKLERAESVLKELNKDYVSYEQLAGFIKTLAGSIKTAKDDLAGSFDQSTREYMRRYAALSKLIDQTASELEKTLSQKADAKQTSGDIARLRTEVQNLVSEVWDEMPDMPDMAPYELELARLKSAMPPKVDDKSIWKELKALAEKLYAYEPEMADLRKQVKEKTGSVTRVGWGAHPLMVQGLGVLIDKNTRAINFKGAGVSSVTRRKDGVVEVTVSGGGAAAGTLVSEEVPTDSGNHINFTLAHSPDAGTLRVYRGGARQASIGTTPDFTHTGTALVLSSALDTANGEVLFADYSYT